MHLIHIQYFTRPLNLRGRIPLFAFLHPIILGNMWCFFSCLSWFLFLVFLDLSSFYSTVSSKGSLSFCQVGWGCRIYRLHPCRGASPPKECPSYDTKQSDGKVPVMLEPRGMWSTPSLPSLPGQLWPGVVIPERVLSMG